MNKRLGGFSFHGIRPRKTLSFELKTLSFLRAFIYNKFGADIRSQIGCLTRPIQHRTKLYDLRVEFLLKTESGYLRDAEVT